MAEEFERQPEAVDAASPERQPEAVDAAEEYREYKTVSAEDLQRQKFLERYRTAKEDEREHRAVQAEAEEEAEKRDMVAEATRLFEERRAQRQAAKEHKARQKMAAGKDRVKSFAQKKTPEKMKNPTDMQVRIRTGAVYIGLTLACVLAGDIPTVVMLSIVAGMCAGEFYYMLRSDAKMPNEVVGIVAAVLYPPAMYFFGVAGVLGLTLLLMLVLFAWYVFWLRSRIVDVCVCFFGAVYTGLMLVGLVVIRMSLGSFWGGWGGVLLAVLFLSVWGNDAFAYLAGSKFGKHKMAPRVSPKKSWEGFFVGIFSSAVFWVIMSFVPGVTMPVPLAIVFGLICGCMEVLGDLAESRIKRNVGVKDSGTIMPGHGGLLDRCDSLFLASITAALLLVLGGCIPYVL